MSECVHVCVGVDEREMRWLGLIDGASELMCGGGERWCDGS